MPSGLPSYLHFKIDSSTHYLWLPRAESFDVHIAFDSTNCLRSRPPQLTTKFINISGVGYVVPACKKVGTVEECFDTCLVLDPPSLSYILNLFKDVPLLS